MDNKQAHISDLVCVAACRSFSPGAGLAERGVASFLLGDLLTTELSPLVVCWVRGAAEGGKVPSRGELPTMRGDMMLPAPPNRRGELPTTRGVMVSSAGGSCEGCRHARQFGCRT